MKKIISLFTTLCIVLGVLGTFTVFAEETATDLEISTLTELEAFRDDVNKGNTYEGKTVKLTADIDMSYYYGKDRLSWTPIDTFAGTFDGDNHAIIGLYINTDEDCAALFEVVNGTIKNLIVKGSVSTTSFNGQVAGIAVSNYGSVINCIFDGTVECPHCSAAGIASFNNGVIENCKVSGKIIGEHNVGGISGYSHGEFINCINEAEIIGWAPVGGIASAEYESKFINCINKGSITGKSYVDIYTNGSSEEITTIIESFSIGGIVGETDTASTIENCYNTGAVSGNSEVGGIIGVAGGSSEEPLQVKSCYSVGQLTSTMEKQDGEHNIGAIIGNREYKTNRYDENSEKILTAEAVNCYYLVGTADKGCGGNADDTATALTTEQFADKSNFANWDFDIVWEMDANVGRPVLRSNTEDTDEVIEISTLAQLEAFRDDVNNGNTYEGKTVKLTADIDMSEKYGEGKLSWEPISDNNLIPFIGTFDGCFHKITGLYFNTGLSGLFMFNNGTIQNVAVSGDVVCESGGGIVGENYGRISRCSYSGSITGGFHLGGIAGANMAMDNDRGIFDCYNTATVTSNEGVVGGIAGLTGRIERCYNIGKVSANDMFASVGAGDGPIIDCYYLEGTSDKGWYIEYEGVTDTTTALTSEQFADKSNFTNWDFDTVWKMDATLGRPVLRSGTEEPPIETHTHTLVHHAAVDATCTEKGMGEYWKCEGTDACNKMFSDANGTTEITEILITEAIGHSYGAWSITIEPTISTTGKAERICLDNNTHKDTVNLPVLTDTTVWEEGLKIEPTETENGSVTYTSQYGNVQIIIPAFRDETFPYEITGLVLRDSDILPENSDFVVKYTITQIAERNTSEYDKFFVAAYDTDGKLICVSSKNVKMSVGQIIHLGYLIEPNGKKVGSVKAFAWDGFNSMKPLAETKTLVFNEN